MMHQRQSELIEYLVAQLTAMTGVKALYLKGSVANETDDAFSDVDFYCLTDEASYEMLMGQREVLLEAYRPIIYKSHVNFGTPQIIVIFDHDLHLDFYVTKNVPVEGVGQIKVLYDPENLLSNYKSTKRVDDPVEIKDYLDDAIYTLHELNIAIQRNDDLWAIRLETHILAYLSLVLSHMYEPDRPVLHMKGVYHHIPEALQQDISEILANMSPDHIKDNMKLLIDLIDKIITSQNQKMLSSLNLAYLEYMKRSN